MMAMTTSNSMSVNPVRFERMKIPPPDLADEMRLYHGRARRGSQVRNKFSRDAESSERSAPLRRLRVAAKRYAASASGAAAPRLSIAALAIVELGTVRTEP